MNFEEKQEKLDKSRKSELVFAKDVVISSLGDILYYLFYEQKYPTYWFRNDKYYLQHTGGARSIEDFYLLAKSYFPNITYVHAYKAVVFNYHENVIDHTYKYPFLGHSWCHTVKRRVHSIYGSYNSETKELINRRLSNNALNITK